MRAAEWIARWKAEESVAHLHGWDLSRMEGRYPQFEVLQRSEAFRPIRFFEVGALVWFVRIIQWAFPGFSVDTHIDGLLNAQRILEENGSIDGSIHRFLLVAQK